MSDLKIQGVVEMSSEGAEKALDRVGEKAGQMANRLEREADKAGKAVDGLGAGATDNAEQFSRAEGKIIASIKRTTQSLEQLGKSASQKIELRIANNGLDPSKFEPAIAKLRELESAQARVVTSSRGFGGSLQNTSYQLQDFIVQVNGGTDATKALGQQLPQMLIGFGAAGAAIGVLAAMLPNLIPLFYSSADSSKKLSDTMSDLDKAIGEVGGTIKQFDMEKLYEEFNKASGAARGAMLEQLNFQKAFIETSRLVASQKFGETVGGLGSYGTLDKLAGSLGSGGAEKLAKQLGIGAETAKDLLPVLTGLKAGTEDVNLAFNRFGTTLLGGNKDARELAATMAGLSKSERDAAAASTAISEAQAKMAAGHVLTKKEADAAAKATKDLAKENEALDALLGTINSKDSGLDSNYVKNVEMLLEAYDRGKLSLGGFNEAFSRYVAMQPAAVAAAKEIAKSNDDYAKALTAALDPLEKQARSLEEQVATYGMAESAIQLTTIARLEDARAMAEANGAWDEHLAYLDKEIELRKRIAGAASQKEYLDANKKAAEAASREWEKVGDDINRALTDALMRGFESGKSFGQNFTDSLKASLKTLVIKVIVNMTTSAAGGLLATISDAALGTSFSKSGGSSGGLLGTASNLSSAYNLANGNYLAAAQAAYGYGSTALGYTYGTSALSQQSLMLAAQDMAPVGGASAASSGAGAGSSGASGAAGGVATVAWVAAIVAGMWMSSEAWKAGIRWENYAKQKDVALWDAEVAIRAAQDAPAKAIFGEGFVNSQWYAILTGSSLSAQIHYGIQSALFGAKRVTGTQTNGTFSEADQGFSGQYGVNMKKTGGLFSSSREWTDWFALPDQIDGIMDTLYRGVRNSFIMLGETFDDTSLAAKMQGFVYRFNIASTDTATVANAAANGLSEAIGNILTPSISSLKQTGETWMTAFERILNEANSVSRVMELMGKTMSGTFGQNNLDGVLKASDAFITMFGSVKTFNESFAAYFSNFYSQQDQAAQGWRDLSAAFDQIGKTMPTTRQGFRDLVDSLDLNTDSGRSAFQALMNIQGAFAALTPTLEDAAAAASAMIVASREMQAAQIGNFYAAQRKAQQSAISEQMNEASVAATAAASLIDSFRSISTSLSSYRDSLRAGTDTAASPQARYDAAKAMYGSTASQARLGSIDAASSLQGVAQEFLSAAMDVGTAGSYAADVAGVIATLDSVIGMADRQVPIAESQLSVANEQLVTLQAILDSLSGNQMPAVVGNYQQAATDWAQFFTGTAVGSSIQNAAGTMQRISESMGLLIDSAGNGFTFSQNDNPYTLAAASSAYREYLLSKYGAWTGPSFAGGGYHSGGLRLVGENGPELEFTGPSSILSASDTASLLNGSGMTAVMQSLLSEISDLRAEVRAGQAAIVNNTGKTARMLDKFDIDGMPEVRAA